MELSSYQLGLIIKSAAELGAIAALIRSGALKPYLNKSEAFKKYGRKVVERWVGTGMVTIRKDGNFSAAWRLDRLELEILSRSLEILNIIHQ